VTAQVFVLAGTFSQAKEWAAKNKMPPTAWCYLPPSQLQWLRGHREVVVAYTGTWHERDYSLVDEQLKVYDQLGQLRVFTKSWWHQQQKLEAERSSKGKS
jgi:hypothetical protein